MTPDRPAHARDTEGCRFTTTRTFNAPRDLVWRAWTESDRIAQWWGPKGFVTRVVSQDLTPGGHWRYIMTGPDGAEYPASGVFSEVVPLERIVTTDEFDEGFEDVIGAKLPEGLIMSVHFEDAPGGTRVTIHIDHATPEDRRRHEEMGVVEGWNSSLDCLEEYLAASTKA